MKGDSQHPGAMLCTATGKIMYPTRKDATLAAINFKRRKLAGKRGNGGTGSMKYRPSDRALHAYLCEHCEHFHCGNRTGKHRSAKHSRRLHHKPSTSRRT